MGVLAAIVIGAGLATSSITGYFRSQDPIYQCISDPLSQPFQISVPVTVTEDGSPAVVRKGVGIGDKCTRPIHTLEENVIHVAYSEQYPFTLGHFIYYWLGQDIQNYNVKVYVNGVEHRDGSFLDIVLEQGQTIRIELTHRQ